MANIVGTTGNDTLTGTDGPDTIDGIMGTDYLYGGVGNDLFVFSGVKTSSPAPPVGLIDGGDDFDTIDVSNVSPTGFSNNRLRIGNQEYDVRNIERIILGDAPRSMSFTNSAIEIVTGSGADKFTITGKASVSSGGGDDYFFVSPDGANLTSGMLNAGSGTDLLRTNIVAYVDLAAGIARVWHASYSISGFENVEVAAYDYDTYVGGDAGNNRLSVWLNKAPVGVQMDGRDGNDELIGGDGADTLSGGNGNDRISGGKGADTIFGGAGNDIIEAVGDGDSIDGGFDFDIVNYKGLTRGYITSHHNGAATVGVGTTSDKIAGVENINFRDATLTFDADSNAAFVMRLYDSTFDRGPDAQGLDYWLDQMDAGVSKSTVATAFLQSPEFAQAAGTLSTEDFVDFLYVKALGRPSETTGKAYWIDQIDGGLGRGDALLSFSESAEHRVQTADTLAKGLWVTDDKYQAIAALYDTFSNRLPDEDGLGYWVGQLQSGKSLSEIASGFAASSEFSNATAGFSNSQLVDFMYENALERTADADGREYWIDQLDRGLSKGDLMLGFSESAEHYNLLESHIFAGVDYFMAA